MSKNDQLLYDEVLKQQIQGFCKSKVKRDPRKIGCAEAKCCWFGRNTAKTDQFITEAWVVHWCVGKHCGLKARIFWVSSLTSKTVRQTLVKKSLATMENAGSA